MTKVVSFINYKGGVGKTTLAVEIAAGLAYHHEKQVLLIDSDPQTNATFYLMEEDVWEENYANKGRTIKELFDAALEGKSFDINNIIIDSGLRVHQKTNRLHLIPSHLDLYWIDLELASRIGPKALRTRNIIRTYLEKIKEKYDYIILDCPPNMNLVTQNAIVASESIVIICLPEFLSIVGIGLIRRIVDDISKEIRKDIEPFGGLFQGPQIKGIIFNRVRYGPSGILYDQKLNMENVKRQYADITFANYVSETVKFPEKLRTKMPISISGYADDRRYEGELRAVIQEFIAKV
jgi:chromosome partitioning protein